MPAGLPRRGQKGRVRPQPATAATLPPLSSTGTVSAGAGQLLVDHDFFTVRPGRPGSSSRSPVLRGRTVICPSQPEFLGPTGASLVHRCRAGQGPLPSRAARAWGGCLLQGGRSLPGEHQISYPSRCPLRQIQPGGGVPPPARATTPQMGGRPDRSISVPQAGQQPGPPGAQGVRQIPHAAAGRRRVPARGGSPPPPFPPGR